MSRKAHESGVEGRMMSWHWRIGLGVVLMPAAVVQAQVFIEPGDVALFDTAGGGGGLLTRAIELVDGGAAGLPDRFRFEIGFATTEAAGGGVHDSLTVTLTTTTDTPVAVLATVDVFGLTLAPVTPGGVEVVPGDFSLGLGSPPVGFGAGASVIAAVTFDYLIPPALLGLPLRAYFDLVDNGDGLVSTAYVTVPDGAAPVPEASEMALMTALGLAGWIAASRWRRSGA